jgi:hypothetical protein
MEKYLAAEKGKASLRREYMSFQVSERWSFCSGSAVSGRKTCVVEGNWSRGKWELHQRKRVNG